MNPLVVFDTNAFVSYLFPSQKITAVKIAVSQIATGGVIPVYSIPIMTEYEGVLHRPKFHFSAERIHALLELVLRNGLYVDPLPTRVPFADSSDKPFYDAAVAAGAWLVTGNKKHYPNESFVASPRQWLDLVGL